MLIKADPNSSGVIFINWTETEKLHAATIVFKLTNFYNTYETCIRFKCKCKTVFFSFTERKREFNVKK